MNTRNNARLTPKGREQMVRSVVERGLSNAAAVSTDMPETWPELGQARVRDGILD
jgi:hypothetical protein